MGVAVMVRSLGWLRSSWLRSGRLRYGLVMVVIAIVSNRELRADIFYHSVALLGDAVPDSGGQVFSNSFNPPTINNAGDVAFHAYVNDSGGSNRRAGIFKTAGGSLQSVAFEGEVAPGTTRTHRVFFRPVISGDGDVAFSGWLNSATTSNSRGVWAEDSGTLQALEIHSSSVLLQGLALGNQAGATTLRLHSSSYRLAKGPLGSATVLAESGGLAAGTGGATYDDFISRPTINDNGHAAYSARISGTGVTADNNFGIWAENSSGSQLVVRTGGLAAGTTENFATLSLPSINVEGDVVFTGQVTGDANSNAGLWKTTGGVPELIAREGDVAPGSGGDVFRSFSRTLLNANGEVAFRGVLSDGREGIWSTGMGGLEMVALQGAQLQGLAAGTVVQEFIGGFALNAQGQTAFSVRAAGSGITDDRILFVQDPYGALRVIARRGMTLTLANGETVTVSTTSPSFGGLSGNGDGFHSGFNDFGQVAFSASTDKGQGIFVATVAIPEPSSTTGLMLSLLWFCNARCRRTRIQKLRSSRS